ncbi:MAG TPA: hypothetical protein VM122_11765 [Usitatibacter sp.]|nr:hypothetical protein [Usitatibacter sp.]
MLRQSLLRGLRYAAAVTATAAIAPVVAAVNTEAAPAQSATDLRAKYAELRASLERNQFGRPVHLDSSESGGQLKGEVHALLAHPFAKVRDGLASATSWCDILTLPFNVKRCESTGGNALALYIGRTRETPLAQCVRIDFRYSAVVVSDDLLKLQLEAPNGPLGTKNYRIVLDAVPLDSGRTFMHMSYGYGYGTVSKIAMQAYLSTTGASKVGFSSEGDRLVGGMRGVLERNTMRYFLAIDAYLNTLSIPAGARQQKRLLEWFESAERYPRQLHEMTREEYVEMKTRDLAPGQDKVASGS